MGYAFGELTHHDLPAFTRGAVADPYISSNLVNYYTVPSRPALLHTGQHDAFAHNAKSKRGGSHEQV